MQIKKNIGQLIKISGLFSLITFSFINNPVIAANGVTASVESIFVPLGKTTTNDSRTITLLYGVKGFSEITENWRISYGISATALNGFLTSFPISIAYVPTGDYKVNIRPQIFAGLEPFYSNFPDFQGFKLYGHVGLGIDYMINDNWLINLSTKAFINDSFLKQSTDVKLNGLNTGVISLSGGIGYKFL